MRAREREAVELRHRATEAEERSRQAETSRVAACDRVSAMQDQLSKAMASLSDMQAQRDTAEASARQSQEALASILKLNHSLADSLKHTLVSSPPQSTNPHSPPPQQHRRVRVPAEALIELPADVDLRYLTGSKFPPPSFPPRAQRPMRFSLNTVASTNKTKQPNNNNNNRSPRPAVVVREAYSAPLTQRSVSFADTRTQPLAQVVQSLQEELLKLDERYNELLIKAEVGFQDSNKYESHQRLTDEMAQVIDEMKRKGQQLQLLKKSQQQQRTYAY
eukprot:jgi/Chlat1/442/Chrsp103S01014